MKKIMLAIVLCLSVSFASADSAQANTKAISVVIGALFDSLQKGDAKAAFELQTPDTKRLFSTPEKFLEAIQGCCNALTNTHQASLADLKLSGLNAAATVLIIDRSGGRWVAVFVMEQHYGVWQIDACHTKPFENKPVKSKPRKST